MQSEEAGRDSLGNAALGDGARLLNRSKFCARLDSHTSCAGALRDDSASNLLDGVRGLGG